MVARDRGVVEFELSGTKVRFYDDVIVWHPLTRDAISVYEDFHRYLTEQVLFAFAIPKQSFTDFCNCGHHLDRHKSLMRGGTDAFHGCDHGHFNGATWERCSCEGYWRDE